MIDSCNYSGREVILMSESTIYRDRKCLLCDPPLAKLMYVIKVTASGKYHFNLLAGNGEPILSSQMYAARKGAVKGIRSVMKNAPEAPVVDLTAKNVVPAKNPKFEIYEGKDGKCYFRLIAANAKAIGRSEGYNTMAACKNGIKSVKKNAESEIEKTAKKPAK